MGRGRGGPPHVLRYCGMKPDERTVVIANAARLLKDAKLLVDHTRFASAFALAVLGVEEIGKVILDIWASAAPLSKSVVRRSAHIRKQAAVSSLLLGSFAVREFGTVVDDANEELIQRVAEAFRLSPEGKLMSQVQGGALDKAKQLGLYHDDWLTDASLHADQFSDADVHAIFSIARRAIEVVDDARIMRTGRAIYET
ncbi:AbiV family abortive infection protein [Bradyrhizobium ottawaense]|uniref:AbiV family abortive infection protein n=2 Tax=Nitrobacteraceae TaxID=41294 RepID=A0ABV4FK33_9BRAD